MNVIILAAGQGTRLRPLTDDRPKCLVPLHGTPLLQWQLAAARSAGIRNISVVRGYLKDTIQFEGVSYYENDLYDSTNMVETLWCAEPEFEQGFVVAYGDIVYEPRVMRALLDDAHPISVVVDQGWQDYWSRRFDNVLDDAETLKLDDQGRITEIGQKPSDLTEIQSQYIGLMAFRNEGVAIVRQVYQQACDDHAAGKNPFRGQRPLPKMYMTDLLQGIIDQGHAVQAVQVARGWVEVDSPEDLEVATKISSPAGDLLRIEA